VNTGAPWPTPSEAKARVLEIQTKLHRWATDDHCRRFDDLFNLVCDPAIINLADDRGPLPLAAIVLLDACGEPGLGVPKFRRQAPLALDELLRYPVTAPLPPRRPHPDGALSVQSATAC